MGTTSAEAPRAPAAAAPRAVDHLAHRADLLPAGAESAISPDLADLATRAVELETTELEPTSRRTYQFLARDYERFCAGHGLDAFASSSVRLYLVDRVDAAEPARPSKSGSTRSAGWPWKLADLIQLTTSASGNRSKERCERCRSASRAGWPRPPTRPFPCSWPQAKCSPAAACARS
jgi:hypothetical protein